MAAGPIANKNKVVALGTSTTAEGITDIGDYIFRNAVPESLAVDTAIKEAHKVLGFKQQLLCTPITMTKWYL